MATSSRIFNTESGTAAALGGTSRTGSGLMGIFLGVIPMRMMTEDPGQQVTCRTFGRRSEIKSA
jgi:hypothetical protein